MTKNKSKIEKVLDGYLEDNSLEDFLEEFDITPLEVVTLLFEEGYLDEELLKNLTPVD